MFDKITSHPFLLKIKSNNYLRIALGAVAGSIVGLLYWNYIGCSGGTCPLTSNVYKTVIIFTFMGGLFAKK